MYGVTSRMVASHYDPQTPILDWLLNIQTPSVVNINLQHLWRYSAILLQFFSPHKECCLYHYPQLNIHLLQPLHNVHDYRKLVSFNELIINFWGDAQDGFHSNRICTITTFTIRTWQGPRPAKWFRFFFSVVVLHIQFYFSVVVLHIQFFFFEVP